MKSLAILAILASLVLAALAPSAAAQGGPQVGAPKTLPGDLAVGPAGGVQASGVQQYAAIAAGPGVHLAAWADHRSAFETLTAGVGTRDVYAQLLGADGTPLSALPFRVAGGLGRKEDVQVAWNGTHWLVTWQNEAPTQFSARAALFGARVDAQGTVLDVPPIVIRSYQWSSTFFYGLGSNGNTWAVVMQGSQGGEANVEGWLVHPNGTPQQVSTSLFATPYLLYDFQLGWDGSQYLLTWEDSGIKGYRATSTLGLLGSKLTLSAIDDNRASIASDGNGGFLVSYTHHYAVGSNIQYRRVTATGGLGTVTTVSTSAAGEQNASGSLVWNGSAYTLAWWRIAFATSTLRFARIDAAGTLLTPGGITFGQGVQPSFPELSSLGDGNVQAVWFDRGTTPPHPGDVLGTRITPAGSDPGVAVATSASRQGFPDMTPGPTGYMAVFTSERNGTVSIVAQRVSANGDALDPEPIELGAKSTYGSPGVAWNGQHYLVVWHDLMVTSAETDDVVLGRRVASDGTLLDAAPFQVLLGADPSVAAAGDRFLVAARFAQSTEIYHINGARVDATGTVLDPIPFQIGGNFARWPSVSSFQDRWLVAWQRNPSHDNPSTSVLARVVFPDASMAAGEWISGGPRPSAAASPTTGLVAWGGGDIHVQRIAPDGTLLGGVFVASSAANAQYEATAAWNGSEFLVAWQDQRSISAYFDDRHDIYGTRVSEAGVVLDPAGLAIAYSTDDEQMPVVAGRDGAALVAFGAHLPGPPHATVRTTIVGVGIGGPGVVYCSGDGTGTACPCGNVGATGHGCANSAHASGAALAASGSASIAASDLVLLGSDLPAGQPGLYFQANNAINGGQGTVYGDGLRCAGGGVIRLQVALSSGAGTSSTSTSIAALGGISAGDVRYYQLWYRDPFGSLCGSPFNLTNGLELAWLP